jgi:hypothetical protein
MYHTAIERSEISFVNELQSPIRCVNRTPVIIIIFGVQRNEKGLLGFLVGNVAGGRIQFFFRHELRRLKLDCSCGFGYTEANKNYNATVT